MHTWDIDIDRTHHTNNVEYTFFSAAHRTSSKTDHIKDTKLVLTNIGKLNFLKNVLPDHNRIKRNQQLEKMQTAYKAKEIGWHALEWW